MEIVLDCKMNERMVHENQSNPKQNNNKEMQSIENMIKIL